MTTGRTAFQAYWHAFGEGNLPWEAITPAEKERWARMETEISGFSDSLEHRRYVEDELDDLKNQVAILTRKTELRDWFAGHAMAALITQGEYGHAPHTSYLAYAFADAMLKKRESTE